MSTLSVVFRGITRDTYFAGSLTSPFKDFTEIGRFVRFDWTFDEKKKPDVFKTLLHADNERIFEYAIIDLPGLYAVQSIVFAINVGSRNDLTVELSLCIDGQFSGRRVTAVAVLPYGKKVVFGAFGLLHLKKDQKLAVCFDSPGTQKIYETTVFSIAKLEPCKQPPGFQQQLLVSGRADGCTEWTGSGLVTGYERGKILSANTSIPSRAQQMQILVGGIYLFSVSSERYSEAAGSEDVCFSAHRRSTCKLQASIPARKGNATASLVGLLELKSGTKLWTCLNGSRTILSARRSVHLLAGAEASTSAILMHNSTTFHGGGWQGLTNWFTRDGEIGLPQINVSGLYVVAVNINFRARPVGEVSVQVTTSSLKAQPVLLATFDSSEASDISFSAAGVATVTKGDAFSVLVHTAGQLVLPDIHPVPATFYFVKLREGKPGNCFAVRYPQPMQLNVVSEWRTAIGEEWIAADQQCLPPSGERRGTFVSRENGVYLVAATVRLRLDDRNNW